LVDAIKQVQKALDKQGVPVKGRKLAFQGIDGNAYLLSMDKPNKDLIELMPEYLRNAYYEDIG